MPDEQFNPETSKWEPAESLPYYYGAFPYLRETLKGTANIAWIGWGEGMSAALFADWGDE